VAVGRAKFDWALTRWAGDGARRGCAHWAPLKITER
jgi:hypothetical protein